jgi:hypothetical protein
MLEGTMSSYIKGFFVKCLENLSSAKMWMFILPFVVSTAFMGVFLAYSLHYIHLTLKAAGISPEDMSVIIGQLGVVGDVFIAWCTFNVSLASVIIAVREVFKVKKMQALAEVPDTETGKQAAVEINLIKT